MINYGKHFIDKDDIESVISVLKSDFLTQGPKIQEFESALKKKFGAKYVACTSSGTASLHLCGLALNWTRKDLIVASPLTFVATTNAALYLNAKIDLIDIDKETYNIDIKKLKIKLDKLKKKKKKNSYFNCHRLCRAAIRLATIKKIIKKIRFQVNQ